MVPMQVLPRAAIYQERMKWIEKCWKNKRGKKGQGVGRGLQQEASYQATDGHKPEVSDTKEFCTEVRDKGSERETHRELQL